MLLDPLLRVEVAVGGLEKLFERGSREERGVAEAERRLDPEGLVLDRPPQLLELADDARRRAAQLLERKVGDERPPPIR
jgi:hypothetical protein